MKEIFAEGLKERVTAIENRLKEEVATNRNKIMKKAAYAYLHNINTGDRVKIIHGDYIGSTGIFVGKYSTIDGIEVTVRVSDEHFVNYLAYWHIEKIQEEEVCEE